MLNWIYRNIETTAARITAERQWKDLSAKVFAEGQRPDTNPEGWEKLCLLEKRFFPGRLVAPMVGFLQKQPDVTPRELNLFTGYIDSLTEIPPPLGETLRGLTDPRRNPDPGSRLWAWTTLFEHDLHTGHFGRLMEPVLRHESNEVVMLTIARLLQKAGRSPAFGDIELCPVQSMLKHRLLELLTTRHSGSDRGLEKQSSGYAWDMEKENLMEMGLWEMRLTLHRYLPDNDLLTDFHRTLRLHSHASRVAPLCSVIEKAPREIIPELEIVAFDGLLRRLDTHPNPVERRATRELLAVLFKHIGTGRPLQYLINNLSTGQEILSETRATLLHDMLFSASPSHLQPPDSRRLSPEDRKAAEQKVWELTVAHLLTRPAETGASHQRLLMALNNPVAGRRLADVVRDGLSTTSSAPELISHLNELMLHIGNPVRRLELWETMARQLSEKPVLADTLSEMTHHLPARSLVNHLIHRSPEFPPEAATMILNRLWPVVREVPVTCETPSRVALRQLWEQIPVHTQHAFRQQHPEVSTLVEPPVPVAADGTQTAMILPDNPYQDPSPFLAFSPAPGQSPVSRLGEVLERFLPVAADDPARWDSTWHEVLKALPDDELFRRLARPHVWNCLQQQPVLRSVVLVELESRIDRECMSAGDNLPTARLRDISRQLAGGQPFPVTSGSEQEWGQVTSPIVPLPTCPPRTFRPPNLNGPGR